MDANFTACVLMTSLLRCHFVSLFIIEYVVYSILLLCYLQVIIKRKNNGTPFEKEDWTWKK